MDYINLFILTSNLTKFWWIYFLVRTYQLCQNEVCIDNYIKFNVLISLQGLIYACRFQNEKPNQENLNHHQRLQSLRFLFKTCVTGKPFSIYKSVIYFLRCHWCHWHYFRRRCRFNCIVIVIVIIVER